MACVSTRCGYSVRIYPALSTRPGSVGVINLRPGAGAAGNQFIFNECKSNCACDDKYNW